MPDECALRYQARQTVKDTQRENERVRQEAKGEAAELARLTKENTALKARSAASRHHALIHLRHRGLTLG